MKPVPRRPVYDEYWRFAAERQAIFLRRSRSELAPWTDDHVLGRYKFCNTYRASDRISQYLIREVIYAPEAEELDAEDVFMRIVLFRLFSKESTWELLSAVTQGVTRKSFDLDAMADALDRSRQRGPIYTSAFILAPHPAYGYDRKHRNHLALVADMFRPGKLGRRIAQAASLRDLFEALIEWPMIGPFMGYQLAIDLNYSDLLPFSENDFTVPGPGAIRGLRKVFEDWGDRTPSELIMEMVENQEREFDRLGLDFEDLWKRPLHAIDCQGLFCETDKLSRVRFPQLKSARVRIKQEFKPAQELPEPFYPPKWGINKRIRAERTRQGHSVGDRLRRDAVAHNGADQPALRQSAAP